MIRQLPTNNRLPRHHMSYAQSALPRHRHIGSRTASSSTVHLPSHLATSAADVTRATCHPSSGDTCHFRIGPTVRQKVQICLTRVSTWSCHVSCTDLPHVLYGPATCAVRTCHVSCTDLPRQRPYGLYGLHSQQIFACLTFQTECDIFSIRTPFDKVNIPPESGRRDGHNGVGFVGF
jgi:hypothetical protein